MDDIFFKEGYHTKNTAGNYIKEKKKHSYAFGSHLVVVIVGLSPTVRLWNLGL